jgi:hypothetical protein
MRVDIFPPLAYDMVMMKRMDDMDSIAKAIFEALGALTLLGVVAFFLLFVF